MFIPNQKVLKRVFDLSIYGTRGGPVRMKILSMLVRKKMNINQLSIQLKLDYKTAQYHVRTLEKLGFVKKENSGKESLYSISGLLSSNREIVGEITDLGKAS